MVSKVALAFSATLVLLLIQARRCTEDSKHDQVEQDLQTLSEYGKDDTGARINASRRLMKSALRRILSADNCTTVNSLRDRALMYLSRDEEDFLSQAQDTICMGLCFLSRHTESITNKNCTKASNIESSAETGNETISPISDDSSECHLLDEKNKATDVLTEVLRDYEADLMRNQVVFEAAIDAILNALAVSEGLVVELKGGHRNPQTRRGVEETLRIALGLNNIFECPATAE
ncbi:unnamed protein product [Bemisia tabaci]|uniref:Uncharacterized protein n=1 Tax=Bemisia tabaci TaxID=7038 RepID=A0A9P0A3Q1_BEMTA|nr:unnamed protein product [Bemisia tabaci]